MRPEQCKLCRFGKPLFDSNQQLEAVECHRYAPRPTLVTQEVSRMIWPIMYTEDFCGEFDSKNPQFVTEHTIRNDLP